MPRWSREHTGLPNMKKEEDLDPALTTIVGTANVTQTPAIGLQTKRRTAERTMREKSEK